MLKRFHSSKIFTSGHANRVTGTTACASNLLNVGQLSSRKRTYGKFYYSAIGKKAQMPRIVVVEPFNVCN